LDSGGRSYGRSVSSPISTTGPSNPFWRRVSAALAPARLAPTITYAASVFMFRSPLGQSAAEPGGHLVVQ